MKLSTTYIYQKAQNTLQEWFILRLKNTLCCLDTHSLYMQVLYSGEEVTETSEFKQALQKVGQIIIQYSGLYSGMC